MNRLNKHRAPADVVAALLGLALMLGAVPGVWGDELAVLRAHEGESEPTEMMARYLNGLVRSVRPEDFHGGLPFLIVVVIVWWL